MISSTLFVLVPKRDRHHSILQVATWMLFGLRHGHEGICCSAKSYVVMPSLFIVYYMLWNFVLGLYAMELCPGTIYMLWNFILIFVHCCLYLLWNYAVLLWFCAVMVLYCVLNCLISDLKKRSFAVKGQTAKMPHVASLCFCWNVAVWPTGRLTAKRWLFAVQDNSTRRQSMHLCPLGSEQQTAKSSYFAHWPKNDRRQSTSFSRLPAATVDGKVNRLCRLPGRTVDGKTLDAVRQSIRSVCCNILSSGFTR